MSVPLLLPIILMAGLLRAQEPDGSQPVGAVPPIHAEPSPPAWLRSVSHATAFVDTQHYLYEVYAAPVGGDATWIVRYLMFPEGNEAFREIEQVFLFDNNPKHKPKTLKPTEVILESKSAGWKGKAFKLVDRRDLKAP